MGSTDRERRREGVEAGHEHMERGRGEEWERGQRESKKARGQRVRGASSPFYSESSIPGPCRMDLRQNAKHHSGTYL